jgi:hypothetical protein
VGECADDRRVVVGAQFGAHDERIALGVKIVGRHRVVEYGESLGRDALIHEMLLHGIGDGEQMRLAPVPNRGGEALNVADRWRPAQVFQPATPPACGGERGLNDFGPMLAHGAGQSAQCDWAKFAADVARLGGQAQPVHLADGRTLVLDNGGQAMAAGSESRRHAHELHFGAAHARRRDHL